MRIKLIRDIGSAKPGLIFIKGLHDVPEFYIDKDKKREDFFWEKGKEREDDSFLMVDWVKEGIDYKVIKS